MGAAQHVLIVVQRGPGTGVGSEVAVASRQILTAAHVVSRAPPIFAYTPDGPELTARGVWIDEPRDAALLQIVAGPRLPMLPGG